MHVPPFPVFLISKDTQAAISTMTQKKKIEQPHSTCLYGDHLTVRAVAHKVGGNDVRCVVGAALQALDLTRQIHGVAAVNDTITVHCHGDVENCTAGH